MIDSLEITNWKTHKKTRLAFKKGTNVFIGVMGAGKSSAVDAISFGLFGAFPALTSKRVTVGELITSRPAHETEAEIKLGFTVGDDSYTVIRKIGEKGNTARLEKNGQHLQTQPTKVTEEVENLLKIDYDTFARVVYSEQNRLDYFLELPKGRRKQEIDHMLGLDSFASAEENTTTLINSLKGTVTAEQETLSRFDIKALREQLQKLNEEYMSVSTNTAKLRDEEKRFREQLAKARKDYESMKKQLAAKRVLSEELAQVGSRIETITREIKKIESMKMDEKALAQQIAKLEREDTTMAKELDGLRKEERVISKEHSENEANLALNKKRIAERDKILDEIKGHDEQKLKREIDEANAELHDLMNESASKKALIGELEEWIHELEKHISKCPVCEREMSKEMKEKLLDAKASEKKALVSELKKAESAAEAKSMVIKRLTELHGKITLANSKLSSFKDIDKMTDKLLSESKITKSRLDEVQKAVERTVRAHDSLKEELSKARSDSKTIERKKEYESEVKKHETELKSKKKEHDSIEVNEKSMYALHEEITGQSAAISDMASKAESNDRYAQNLALQIKEKKKQETDFTEAETLISRRQNQVQNLNRFKAALVETEAVLRNRLVSSINSYMQSMWPELYPYGDYASIRLNATKDDYLLEVNTSTEGPEAWIQVDGIASGGERSIGCLAMRIALAMVVVPNLRWLILDEPTHNLDSTGISKLIEVLGEELPSVVDQIFIITHDDNLKQIASAKVYQFERDKSSNSSTIVSEL